MEVLKKSLYLRNFYRPKLNFLKCSGNLAIVTIVERPTFIRYFFLFKPYPFSDFFYIWEKFGGEIKKFGLKNNFEELL